jgi:hypothetical protein
VESNLIRVLALALFPASAWGVVTVQLDRVVVAGPVPYDQTVSLEAFATNPDDAQDERLNAYTIALDAPAFRPDGVRFVVPPPDAASGTIPFALPTAHPYVFGAYPGNGPVDPAGQSDFDTVLLSAALGGAGQEVNLSSTLNGFATVRVLVPANTVGIFPVNLDLQFLSLGSAGPSIAAIPASGFITVGPEPGCLGELAVAGLLALRRRRWA